MLIHSPLGNLYVTIKNEKITDISFYQILGSNQDARNTALENAIKQQLKQYFEGSLTTFTIPIDLQGTPFQKQVWQEIAKIPYGSVITYKDIANNIGKEKASRAVGGACNKNPIPIIIPCHRVIGSNGQLTGYNGGIEIKEYLLSLEKAL